MDISNIAKLIISGVYYILAGGLVFFGAFGVYILLRYGKTLAVSVIISAIYLIFFLTALLSSYAALRAIQSI